MTIRERLKGVLRFPGQETLPPMPVEEVHLVRYYREKKEAEVMAKGRTVTLYDVHNIHSFDPNEVWTWDERTEYRYFGFDGRVRGVLFGTLVIERMG